MQDWLGQPYSLRGKRIWIAGHTGMVGGALLRRLRGEDCEILTAERRDLDLTRQAETEAWIFARKPEVVIVAAAQVGGIEANRSAPGDFLYNNLMIAANVIHGAAKAGVAKLLFLGSSCMYPRDAAQPMREEALLSGAPEPTNEAYALAKIAGLKLCQSYRRQHGHDFMSAIPCNLYGPGDTYDARRSHVIPALLMKAHAAKMKNAPLQVWGSGTPRREFLYVDDLADALLFMLRHYSGDLPLNIGAGADLSIADLAQKIAQATGHDGEIVFDPAKPGGAPRKLMDSSRLYSAGWTPRISLEQGLALAYQDYLARQAEVRHAA